MKLAFSTIGCPGLDWAETCKLAREQGYAGFEVRDLGPRTLTYGKFASSNKAATRAELESQGLRLTCFSIGKDVRGQIPDRRGDLLDPDTAKCARETARHYIKMAAGLGCPCVRLQIDDFFKDAAGDDATVLGALEELVPFADVLGVTLLVETKGVYSDTKRLRALLARFRSNAVGALWDVDHTSHSGGETPAQTVENLGGLIKYVHLRDSRAQTDTMEYRQGGAAYRGERGGPIRMGEGDVPIHGAMRALRSIDFNGVLSFEWRGDAERGKSESRKAYIQRIKGPFQDFVSYMAKEHPGELDAGMITYDNLRSDGGKYFWPKKTIIDATLPQVLDRVCRSFPDQIAFKYNSLEQASQYYRDNVRPNGYRVTYRRFREDVDTFARSLISLGVCRGDKVAIWCPNLPEWFITLGGGAHRRGAGDGQHRLQGPRNGIPAAPERYAPAGDVRRREGQRLPGHHPPDLPGAARDAGIHGPLQRKIPHAAQHRHHREQAAGLPDLAGGHSQGQRRGRRRLCRPHGGNRCPRRVQHAVHLRHHGLPKRRDAHALQHRQQRQVHRRLHGLLHR